MNIISGIYWLQQAPSYSLLRMEEHPAVGGDTAWVYILRPFNLSQTTSSNPGNQQVSQYGLYDALSDAYKKFLDGLHAVHTSRLQCQHPIPLRSAKKPLTKTPNRWHNPRPLGRRSKQTTHRHPPSRRSNAPSHRTESPEREQRVRNRVCRTQETGIGLVFLCLSRNSGGCFYGQLVLT